MRKALDRERIRGGELEAKLASLDQDMAFQLQSELEAMRKALDRERIRGGELEAKLASLDQDMAFQLQLKNTELEEERKRNHVDLSAIDTQMKSEYEKRLKAELMKLRRMYEEETEKAKQEFMYLHSSKVEELQE